MKELEQLKEQFAKWNEELEKVKDKCRPYIAKAKGYWGTAKKYWAIAWPWIWRFRKVLFAIPVVYLMLYFARLNWNVLPEQVGLSLQSTGEYARYITREMAVYGPMAVTGGCLAMMFLSRRTLYPWLICMFSMLLPGLILITNIFPA